MGGAAGAARVPEKNGFNNPPSETSQRLRAPEPSENNLPQPNSRPLLLRLVTADPPASEAVMNCPELGFPAFSTALSTSVDTSTAPEGPASRTPQRKRVHVVHAPRESVENAVSRIGACGKHPSRFKESSGSRRTLWKLLVVLRNGARRTVQYWR